MRIAVQRGVTMVGGWSVRVWLLVLVGAALARSSALKRAEMSPVPFVMGSRYGRSPPRMIAPRNDRSDMFFMGSRYGKRSEAEAEPVHLWRTTPCDCSYERHAQPRTFFNRILDAPPRLATED